MARRKRYKPHAQQSAAPIAEKQWVSGYDGANISLRRGDVFIDLDTRRELDSFSRQELMRRVRWLYINVGFVRGIVRNGAALVGWMCPQARTKDKDFDRAAEKRFAKRTSRAENFDRSGKFNVRTAQKMLQCAAKKDGDILTVLTTNEAGTAPAVAFYEAHQLANPENPVGRWVDGVKLSARGDRHIASGLRGEDGKVTIVPATSVIYFGSFDSCGHHRAVSPLAHAVNHAIDITEIRADTKHAIKTAGLMGMIRTRAKGEKPTKSRMGLPGAIGVVSNGTGTKEKRFETREIWGGGQVPELDEGENINVLHDSRPHPNGMAFQDELYRDIAAGYGVQLEAIYKLGRMTGPGTRFLMETMGRWIGGEQEMLAEWGLKVWLYFTAWDLVHGELAYPKAGHDWMEVELMPQRDLTIDRSKDGRQLMEELDRGMGTWADWHRRVTGRAWDDEVEQRVKEVAFAKEKCAEYKLAYAEVFPPRAGAAAVESAAPEEPEDQEEEQP